MSGFRNGDVYYDTSGRKVAIVTRNGSTGYLACRIVEVWLRKGSKGSRTSGYAVYETVGQFNSRNKAERAVLAAAALDDRPAA
jgi:hypothetical protein